MHFETKQSGRLINNDVHDVLLFQDYIGTQAYFMLSDNMANDGNGLHDYFYHAL